MAEYEVGVRLTAHDETAAGTASAESHLKGVDTAAKSAGTSLQEMGSKAGKGAAEAVPHLNSFKDALGEITKLASGFAIGGLVSQLGGGLTETLKGSIDKTKEFYGEVKTLMNVTGGTAEELSTTVAAFERFGVSSDRAASSLSIFARQIARAPVDVEELATGLNDAGKPLKGFADQMHDLGVNTQDATGKSRPILDVFYEAADAIQAMGKSGDTAAVATTLFGRAGREMLPLLLQGSAGIKAVAEEAAKLGMQLTTSNMAQIKAFSDANKDMGEAMNGLKLQVGIALMPVLTALASIGAKIAQIFNENLLPAVRNVADWVGKLVATVKDAWGQFTAWLAPLGDAKDKLGDLLGTIMDTDVNGQKLSDVLTNLAVGMVATGATATVAGIGVDKLSDAFDFLSNAAQTVTSIFEAGVWGTVVASLVLIGGALFVAYQNIQPFHDIVNALYIAFTQDAGALAVVHDVLEKTFGPGVAKTAEPILDFLYKAIPLLGDFGRALVVAFTDDEGAVGILYGIFIKLFGEEAGNAWQPFFKGLMDFIPKLQTGIDFIVKAFGNLFKGDAKEGLLDLALAFQNLTGINTEGLQKGIGDFFDKLSKGDIKGMLGPLGPAFDSIKDAIEKISGAINTLWPDPMQGFIDGMAKGIGDLVKEGAEGGPSVLQKGFDALSNTLSTIVGVINGVAAAFDAVVTAVGNLTEAVKTNPLLQDAMAVTVGALVGVLTYLAIISAINFGIFLFGSGVLTIMTAAMWLYSAAVAAAAFVEGLLFAPLLIGLIVLGALAALFIILYNNCQPFHDAVDALWKILQELWTGLTNQMQPVLKALGDRFNELGTFISENGDTIKTVLEVLMGPLGILYAAWTNDWGDIREKAESFVNWLKNDMPRDIENALSSVGKLFEKLGTAIHDALSHIKFDIGPFHWDGATFTNNLSDQIGGLAPKSDNPNPANNPSGVDTTGVSIKPPPSTDPNIHVPYAAGGWLREPVVGVGPSGTRYMMHANEYISPAGAQSEKAAAANRGYGPYDVAGQGVDALADAIAERRGRGDVSLNVGPGAVVINGTANAAADIAAAADGLWSDLHAKLSRAMDNRA